MHHHQGRQWEIECKTEHAPKYRAMVSETPSSETLMVHFVGGTGGTVVAKSNELRWNSTLRYTDPLGHKTMAELIPQWAFYPKELANNMPLSATRLYEYPGIVREGCTEVNSWNGYKCEGGKQRRVTFESLDGDAVSRRAYFHSPLNVYAKQGHSALNDDNIKRAIKSLHRTVNVWTRLEQKSDDGLKDI